jgi:hypothetical protein
MALTTECATGAFMKLAEQGDSKSGNAIALLASYDPEWYTI